MLTEKISLTITIPKKTTIQKKIKWFGNLFSEVKDDKFHCDKCKNYIGEKYGLRRSTKERTFID